MVFPEDNLQHPMASCPFRMLIIMQPAYLAPSRSAHLSWQPLIRNTVA